MKRGGLGLRSSPYSLLLGSSRRHRSARACYGLALGAISLALPMPDVFGAGAAHLEESIFANPEDAPAFGAIPWRVVDRSPSGALRLFRFTPPVFLPIGDRQNGREQA